MPKQSRLYRERYAQEWVRLLSEKERRMAKAAAKLFKMEARAISKAYKDAGKAAAIQTSKDIKKHWHKMLVNFYDWTIPTFAEFTNRHILGRDVKKPTFLEAQIAFVRTQGLLKSSIVTLTTINRLQKLIAKGVDAGKSQSDIADMIKANLTGASNWRAQTIARTEVHTAASWAQQKTAETSGRDLEREWCAVSDDRTRETHAEADGQVVGMHEPFQVGDSLLDYPGDPNGAPEETINCRCVVLFNPTSVFDVSDYEYF